MAAEATTAARPSHAERARLRAVVLRLGGQLGWSPGEVAEFSEALCGQPWTRLGPAELEAVRDEYLALLQVIATKAARRAARGQGGEHVAGA
jgi:membrane protein required for beta-lactamase induction